MYFRFSCPWNEVSPFRAKYFSIKASKIGNIFCCNLQPEVLHFVHVFLANEPPQHFHLCKLLPRFDRWLAWKFSLPLFYFLLFYFPLYFYFSQFSLGQTFAQVWSRAGINIFTFILLMFYFHFSLLFFTVFTCANFAQVWSRAGMKIRKGAISWQWRRCSRNEMSKSTKFAALLSRESVETQNIWLQIV